MRRLVSFAVGAVLGTAVLAGCAAADSDISTAAAAEMQTTVLAIAESAAAGDAPGALVQLDRLQQQLDGAVTDGSVDAARARVIQTRIDVVRADLQPDPVVEPGPAPSIDTGGTENGPVGDTGNGNSGDNGNGNGNNGNGNNGNGNGNNGNGNNGNGNGNNGNGNSGNGKGNNGNGKGNGNG
ncbi:hypothetical protein NQ152_10365 [Microbacterium sp. zg.B48]|uniref:hypothetical protein n=1 Tax=Microbacterium sp. zg.B48 TaxID=2969408 RepID=UPI00214BA314|nr:hypothetical protein [Microbacterium sp. zg.B48]MCR2763906.1 hypothetical protein [Microbacterium sp. zg.B48]